MIPIIKLPLDILFFNWNRWSMAHDVFPWLCEKGSRRLEAFYNLPSDIHKFLSPHIGIRLHTQEKFNFSIADFIYGAVGHKTIHYFIILFSCVWVLFLIFKLIRLIKERIEIEKLIKNSVKIKRRINNPKISQAIKKHRLKLLENSEYTGSPFVTGYWKQKIIFSSKGLSLYSQKEFEATLAHEINHLRAKDLFSKLLLTSISIIFSWIPTKKLRKYISFNQELSCDQKALSFGVKKIDLATAIQKLAWLHYQKQTYSNQVCFIESTKVTSRVCALSQDKKNYQKILQYPLAIIAAYLLIGIFLGKFWLI